MGQIVKILLYYIRSTLQFRQHCTGPFCYPNIKSCHMKNGVATRSENSNEIVSVTSYLRKTISSDFVRWGQAELFRFAVI